MRRILKVYAKCSDLCNMEYHAPNGAVFEHNGYPLEIPNLGGGDDVSFDLDLESGKIVGWKPMSHKDMLKVFEEDEFDSEEEREEYDSFSQLADVSINQMVESIGNISRPSNLKMKFDD